MYPVARGSRRQDGFHGSDNPFEMMNSQMSMLSSQMDRMMNGMIQPGGGFGGGFGGGGFESMMGGAGELAQTDTYKPNSYDNVVILDQKYPFEKYLLS